MIGYDESEDTVWLIAKALIVDEQGTVVDPDNNDVPSVRFVATRAQMRALSEHALEVVAKGRPLCPLCGRPDRPRRPFLPAYRRACHADRIMSLTLSEEQALDILRRGRIEEKGLLPYSSNHSFLVLVHEDEWSVPAVYKPQRGENPLWDFEWGTLCKREAAAYRGQPRPGLGPGAPDRAA